jgi:hypothetical protein
VAETERDALFQALDALEALQIPYVVVGSFASTFWGRPRMTHDADLVVELPLEKVTELARLLAPHFYAPAFVIEEPYLEHDYLDGWARSLGIVNLLERVRQQAVLPPEV